MGILYSKFQKEFSKLLTKSLLNTPTPTFTSPTATTTSSFPLLQLPSVAIHEVLRTMIHLELVQLSLVSKKTRHFVESLVKRSSSKNKYKLEVIINDIPRIMQMKFYNGESEPIVIKVKRHNWMGSRNAEETTLSESLMKLHGVSIHLKVNQNIHTITAYYWQFREFAVKTMLKYIVKTFNPITSMVFVNVAEKLVTEVLDVIKKENAKLDELSMNMCFLSARVYQQLLELQIRELGIMSCPMDNFCYKPSVEPMKFEKLTIKNARWVNKLEDFLYCKSISLSKTKMKDQDFNSFLKKWMESNYRLECAWVSVNDLITINLLSVVEGLSATPMNRVFTDKKVLHFDDAKCFGLQKSNGEKAIIYQSGSYINFLADSHLSF